ncbi:MAG: hypothetical protein JKY95_19055 [Planctomycetaceae bacterium]|nr:hypothetical protein [Planctomycetaceae bacterium]
MQTPIIQGDFTPARFGKANVPIIILLKFDRFSAFLFILYIEDIRAKPESIFPLGKMQINRHIPCMSLSTEPGSQAGSLRNFSEVISLPVSGTAQKSPVVRPIKTGADFHQISGFPVFTFDNLHPCLLLNVLLRQLILNIKWHL